MRVLRPQGGLHAGLHYRGQVQVRRQMALRPLLRGRAGRGHDEALRLGRGRQGTHVLLPQVQVEPGRARRGRHAPDAPPPLRPHLVPVLVALEEILEVVEHVAGRVLLGFGFSRQGEICQKNVFCTVFCAVMKSFPSLIKRKSDLI